MWSYRWYLFVAVAVPVVCLLGAAFARKFFYAHVSNENELPTPKGEAQRYGPIWKSGRMWIRRRNSEPFRSRSLNLEWSFRWKSGRWGVTFGGGDSDRDLSGHFSIPFVATFYVTLERFFTRQLFDHDFDRGDDREISLSFHGGAIWWHVWVGTMATYGRKYPWCRWWRQGNINFLDVLIGRNQVTTETMEVAPVVIPMPEGVYDGTAKVERRIDKRRRWFARESFSTWIDVPKGVPHAGKGENSWDCGDDGIFGCGVSGRSISEAIGHYVASVLRNRARYGMPSEVAVKQALAGPSVLPAVRLPARDQNDRRLL